MGRRTRAPGAVPRGVRSRSRTSCRWR